MNKLDTLKAAVAGRESDILEYQINIDNYERAIEKINSEHSDKPEIVEFRDQLIAMLQSNRTEQLKTIIIRDVIAEQIKELEAS